MHRLLLAALLLSTTSFAQSPKREIPIPTILVVKPVKKIMQEKFVFSGNVVAREEFLISTEIDGLRITNILAEEGDKVKKGQVLARLNDELLQVQLKQTEASIDKAKAGIEQAKSNIVQADAGLEEAKAQYIRAKALLEKKDIAPTIYDQRLAAFKTAESKASSSRDGLKFSEADLKLIEATKNDVMVRLSRTEIKAPSDGIISRRTAKVGQIIVASVSPEPLFRLIGNGLLELEGDILETRLAALKVGQKVTVTSAGLESTGEIRLVPSEVDRNTRLGRVRVALNSTDFKLGSFARGTVNVMERSGVSVPQSAITVQDNGTTEVQVVVKDAVVTKKVTLGIKADGLIEIRDGLVGDEQVVVRAGPFLRDGDKVKTLEERVK